jgi:hypothetical protein
MPAFQYLLQLLFQHRLKIRFRPTSVSIGDRFLPFRAILLSVQLSVSFLRRVTKFERSSASHLPVAEPLQPNPVGLRGSCPGSVES